MKEKSDRTVRLREVAALIPREKRAGAAWVVAGSVTLALLDLAGIAALVSVMLMVLDPAVILKYPALAGIYSALGFRSADGLIIAVCAAALAVVAVKSILTLAISNAITKYQLSLFGHYSSRMFDICLSKGLLFIRSRHTSQLINNINGVCLRFTDGVFGQLASMLSNAVLLTLILIALLAYDPLIVLLAAVVFLPLALVYSLVFRRRMTENGRMENELFVTQNKTAYEALRGYSDIEINNAGPYVSRKFRQGLRTLAHYRRRAALVRRASGRVTEFSLVLGVVIMITGGLMLGNDMGSLRLSLGIFAVAAYKIVPAVNAIVNSWVEYRRNSFAAETIRTEFAGAAQHTEPDETTERLPFEREISLENISFAYEGGPTVIDGFSLRIGKGEKIGFKGYSGAGKSTLFNILCGFFEPSSGRITVDGAELSPENRRMWQNNLAYVSQEVFIPDATIAENIAFGTERGTIDETRLRRAIESASLQDLVDSLPEGVDTVTGDSGCRLSGGERQRIGIARALYKKASVLMFDEATSSLDAKTESDVVRAIERLAGSDDKLTILIISHREQTLSFCDRVVDMNGPDR